jgi:hypothetical protein
MTLLERNNSGHNGLHSLKKTYCYRTAMLLESAMSAAKKTPSGPAYQLKIRLGDSKPAIWRRIIVPAATRMDTLHLVMQAAMGWENCHLHQFEIDGERYEINYPNTDFGEGYPVNDSAKFRLSDLVSNEKTKFSYLYDFGDGWRHVIILEKIHEPLPADLPPFTCLIGAGACPPEDCGGIHRYYNLLEILSDPEHQQHENMLTWAGGPIDPAALDLAAINRALRKLRFK